MRLLFRLSPLLLLSLSACFGGVERPQASTSPDRSPRPNVASANADTRQCMAELTRAGVRFSALPDQDFGGGCHMFGSVRLTDLGTPATNLGPMTCPLARNFVAWVQYAVKPAARQVYGANLARIETFGTYSCRNVNGASSGRLSQHAYANAVDVSAFVLDDGTRITILAGWSGDDRAQRFLQLIHTSACRRFGTVLSPAYNRLHANHFHFDMSGAGYCR
ncbi:MAG: extensin family protein [Sphingomonadaceae bacterium]|nr:extensin family protein [Sphingomonadaceae bacterium]